MFIYSGFTKKAQVIRQHGDVDEITFEANWPDPEPSAGHVVIRVGACTLNYHDLFTLRGMPGIKVPMPIIMGIDMAGTIEAVGDDWAIGKWATACWSTLIFASPTA